MRDDRLTVERLHDWDGLPEQARALAGADAFSTAEWYRTVSQAGLEPGQRPSFHVVRSGADMLAVFAMQEHAGRLSALTTPYTALWSPMLRPGLPARVLSALGLALGRAWRGFALTRLDAMDADAAWASPLLSGLRLAGLVPLRFDHFGNWHLPVAGLTWDDYLAARPGPLRSAIARRTRRLMDGQGAVLTVTDGQEGLEQALAAYEQVYAASWKQPEPYPAFNPALIRACTPAGSVRLGVLALAGVPVAAQFWLVHAGWAGVQKLAHDEAYKHLAPGTVLTGLMVRRLIEQEQVRELDFGRGDDPYKQSWTGLRRQRAGVLLAVPWRAAGALQIARHCAGRLGGLARTMRLSNSA